MFVNSYFDIYICIFMLYSGINLIPIYAEITPLSIHSADLLPAHTGTSAEDRKETPCPAER